MLSRIGNKMQYSLTALRNLILEQLENAERDAKESHKVAMNSYGAGYDRGMADALKNILDEIPDEAKHE